jgi:hypothetical protein
VISQSSTANPAGNLALLATERTKLGGDGKKKQHVKQQQDHGEQDASTGSGESNNKSNVKCFFCNQLGHYYRLHCPLLKKAEKKLRRQQRHKKDETVAVAHIRNGATTED